MIEENFFWLFRLWLRDIKIGEGNFFGLSFLLIINKNLEYNFKKKKDL